MSDFEKPVDFSAPIMEQVEALFPSYDIFKLIACGGMGAVYHAKQRSLDREVAIKLLPRELSENQEFRIGFETEAKAMAKLNHSNLIGVYDFGEAGGMLFIIMEYAAGGSLFQAAAGHPVEQSEAIRIITAICHGLANAHSNDILHRDIKPANILFDAIRVPKISDFGLASTLGSEFQEGEQIFGTPGYTAPEVIQPPHSFDQRADIFSVGVMLFELLTGSLPANPSSSASQLCSCNVSLDRIIKRAMNPDPERRYKTAADLAADLDKVPKPLGKALRTSGASSQRPMNTPQLKRKSSSGLGMTITLLLIFAACYAYFHFNIKNDQKANAAAEKAHSEKSPLGTTAVQKNTLRKPPASASEKFDTEAFLDEIIAEIAKEISPIPQRYRIQSRTLGREFTTAMKIGIIRIPEKDKNEASKIVEKSSPEWSVSVPKNLPEDLRKIERLLKIHEDYVTQQNQLNGTMAEKVSPQIYAYISKINQQISILNQANQDPAAVEFLNEEVKRTQSDEAHLLSKFLKKS